MDGAVTMASADLRAITSGIYSLVAQLSRHDSTFKGTDLPKNGLYLFYEAGELIEYGGAAVDRIVRVGTHRADNRLPARLRDHYRSNHRGSVFRRHIRNALMQAGLIDADLAAAVKGSPSKVFPAVEEMVSRLLADRYTFAVIRIEEKADRLRLEAGLIAALSAEPLGVPSANWLGHYSISPEIRTSGLWNTHHVGGHPITENELAVLGDLIRTSD